MALHTIAIDNSKSSNAPVVFLHGFGGMAFQWWGLQTEISHQQPTLAFDLPGHAKSLNFPDAGPPVVAARAVVKELERRDIAKAHFVGHSMGGAVSSLVALTAPPRVASLTLLAPGGYGEELNQALLERWAAARDRDELAQLLPHFFGSSYDLPEKIIDFQFEHRQQPGIVEKLSDIARQLFESGKQGMLPVDDVIGGDYPVSVIWGDEDQVLPVEQARRLEGKVDLHIVEGMGHSPAEEARELVKSTIEKNIARYNASAG